MPYNIFSAGKKPGDGLPIIEKWIIQSFILPAAIKRFTRETAVSETVRVGLNCLDLVEGHNDKDLATCITIPRIKGIENSSRHWSLAMTLEHLLIVHRGMLDIIQTLANGDAVSYKTNVADVKPSGTIAHDVLFKDYKHALNSYSANIQNLGDLNNPSHRHTHPWFWDMTAYEWLCVNALHYRVHRKQLYEIMKRL